jgi:hypothetical protein
MTLTSKNYVDTNFIDKHPENDMDNNIVGSVGISADTTISGENPLLSVRGTNDIDNVKVLLEQATGAGTGIVFNGDSTSNTTVVPSENDITRHGGLIRRDDVIDTVVLSYPCNKNHVIFHHNIVNNQGVSFKPTRIVTSKYRVTSLDSETTWKFPISNVDYEDYEDEDDSPNLSNTGNKFVINEGDEQYFCLDTDYEKPGYGYLYYQTDTTFLQPKSSNVVSSDGYWYLECLFDTTSFSDITIEIQCVLNHNFKLNN